jgi:putative hydrolase of the HAD superfamily
MNHGLKVVIIGKVACGPKTASRDFVDFFISSCFVHLRKPDTDIYRLALGIAQVPIDRVLYLDDRLMFVEVAQSLGIYSVHHTDFESTRAILTSAGLSTKNSSL